MDKVEVDLDELNYLLYVIKQHEDVGKTHLQIVHLRVLLKMIFPKLNNLHQHSQPGSES